MYVSRDLDSLFSDRELAAVNQWISGNKSFHMMRDHPQHAINILGSAWGVKLDLKPGVRESWRKSWIQAGKSKSNILWYARNVTGPDQGFLRRYEYNFIEKGNQFL